MGSQFELKSVLLNQSAIVVLQSLNSTDVAVERRRNTYLATLRAAS